MSALRELDRSKVVDIDLGSSEFKQNARDILAEWAKRPPFYVLSSGPAQVICGRYADVHEIFSDTERFSSELREVTASSSSTSSWACSSSPRWMANGMRGFADCSCRPSPHAA